MQNKRGRMTIAIVLLTALLVPAVGATAGDTEDKLQETRSKLDHWRERRETLQAEAGDLRSKLKHLNSQMVEIRAIIAELDGQIEKKELELHAVQERIDRTEAKMRRIEEAATKQAVALYKNGSTETIDALLSAQSLAELDSRADMLGQAAEENTGFLIRYGRLKVEIEEQYQDEYEVKQALGDTRAQHKSALAESKALATEHKATLAKVEEGIDKAERHEGDLEESAQKLWAKIQRQQAAAAPLPDAVQSAGTSAAGFIWPLPGAITSYYGMRWGRLHAGIDIDGTTGQPIAASKTGRVIMAAPYSGYGNAVIIDHGGGYTTLYGHMSGFATSRGQIVSQGQVIGYVGCTGSCTGDHLHFEVRVNGSPRDPMAYLP